MYASMKIFNIQCSTLNIQMKESDNLTLFYFLGEVFSLFLLPDFEIQHLPAGRQVPCSIFDIQGGAVAQLVEQRTENPCVGGSIPPHTTEAGKLTSQSVFPFLFSAKTCFRRAK